jgi:hypothetical protein
LVFRGLYFRLSLAILCFAACGAASFAQQSTTYFRYTSHTGYNATVTIPNSAIITVNNQPLEPGDEIGAFRSDSLCVGAVVWDGTQTAITVWGNNDQTEEIDGMVFGDTISFRIWRKSTGAEYSQNHVSFRSGSPVTNGDGIYVHDGLYILDTLTANIYVTNIEDNDHLSSPPSFSLNQNYPNPFNPETMISYSVSKGVHVRITVYTMLGQEVAVIVDAYHSPGRYIQAFSGIDLPSGTYIYRMAADDFNESKRFVLLR